jgi:glycosyltransferase involved in cell wall biosynthesis
MRIALNGYFWDQPRTGSGQYTRHLWCALGELSAQLPAPQAHHIALLLPAHEPLIHDPQSAPSSETIAQSKIQNPKSKIQKAFWEQAGAPRQAMRIGADMLHVPYLAAPVLKGVPVVVTAHDVIPWVLPAYGGSPLVRLYLALAAAGARRADLVITDSEASRRDAIKRLELSPSKVHTIYLGTDPPPAYTPEQLDEVRSRHGLPADFAFYIGGFDRRKNVPLLLRAWRIALDSSANDRPPTLAIAGDVPQPGGIFPDVPAEAARLGFAGRNGPVHFIGRISEEDKPLLMAAARIFVYPSEYEGFGLDPLAAMSVGCPVVSSTGGSLPEVVGDAGLLVPPNDEKALAGAVVRAWTDSALRERLSAQGRERARLFTWQRTAQETWRLYERVGTKGRGTSRE